MRGIISKSYLLCLLVGVSLLFARGARADEVTTSVNCNGVAGVSSCTFGSQAPPVFGQGFAQATSAATASIGDYGGTASISVYAESYNGCYLPECVTPSPAPATATADIHFVLSTSGPIRPGYLEVSLPNFELESGSGDPDSSTFTATLSIGSFQVGCSLEGQPECTVPSNPSLPNTFLVPFVLGQPYVFDFAMNATASDDDWDAPLLSVSATVNYQIIDAPEPSTWGLMAFAVLGLAVLYAARRVIKSNPAC